jgi:hypothetical protein
MLVKAKKNATSLFRKTNFYHIKKLNAIKLQTFRKKLGNYDFM